MPILEDGQLFERYRVNRWLGSGVAGESYEAEDRILQRKVTLKLIHPWTTLSDSARRHFFREMQGISLLNHPYLATVLDYGEVDGRVYVARRYVSSGSLLSTNGRLWFHPPLLVRDVFKYAHQLAQALQYIHQHGYVHGSLTFANTLVLRGPDAENPADYAPFLLADVGLAHFVRRFGHPRIETLPVSAAPEQVGKRVAPASDQFALAVLLYFWLAGRPPYLGTSTEVEQQKLSETITPLSILNPGITLEQDSIIMRALATYPEDRHSSVLAFTEALNTSLTSAIQLYAAPLNPFTPQPETPRELLQSPDNAVPASPEATVQPSVADPEQSDLFTGEVSPPVQSISTATETTRSSLEELLAQSQEIQEKRISAEVSDTPGEKIEIVAEVEPGRNEIVLFPELPETPRLDESILQVELIAILPDEAASPNTSSVEAPSATSQESPAASSLTDIPSTDAENPLAPPLPEVIPAPAKENSAAESIAAPVEQNDTAELNPASSAEEQPAAETSSLSIEQELMIEIFLTPGEQESTEEFSLVGTTQNPVAEVEAAPVQNEPALEIPPTLAQNESASEIPLMPEEQELVVETSSVKAEQAAVPVELLANENTAEAESVPAFTQQDPATSANESEPSLAPAEPVLSTSELSPAELPAEIVLAAEISISEPQIESILTPEAPSMEPPVEAISSAEIPPVEPPIETAAVSEIPAGESSVEVVVPNEDTDNQAPSVAQISSGTDIVSSDPDFQQLSPVQETHTINSEAYPLLDEASLAPRLIISSPYTSSSFEFLLVDEEVNIGRAGASDLYLEQDNLTSRHHALLRRAGERVLIFDKRSHNGVFLNGQKIEVGRGYELADGDHIGIGNYELIFRSAPSGHVSQLI